MMFSFQMSIFKNEHKSHYSKQDVDILDEFRTVANVGPMRQVKEKNDLIELDISKAYTAAFAKIQNVPVFNEFDLFEPYKGEELTDHCQYIVKATQLNMFFNKRYNLCYGLFLKRFVSITLNGTVCNTSGALDILAVKQPSFVKPVNYAKLVDELWKAKVSDDKGVDSTVKKTIANTNFGMLEKGINKQQRSFIFSTYEECKFYQAEYGGERSA